MSTATNLSISPHELTFVAVDSICLSGIGLIMRIFLCSTEDGANAIGQEYADNSVLLIENLRK